MFFPAEDSEAELELLAVLRLTIQNKRRAFNKTKKVPATATPTTTSMDVVEDMDAVPVRKPANEDEVGAVIWALGAYDESRYLAVAKAGGDPRARIDQAYKPLKKIKIVDCGLL